MLDSSRNRSSPRSFPSYQLQLSTSANSPSLPPPTKVILKPNLRAWFGHRRDETQLLHWSPPRELPNSLKTKKSPHHTRRHSLTLNPFPTSNQVTTFSRILCWSLLLKKNTVAHFSVHAASWVLTHRQLAIQIWNSEIFHLVQSSIHPHCGFHSRGWPGGRHRIHILIRKAAITKALFFSHS